jgi:CRISPR/Cas system-associated exonuclease Cas4 (RecB family)
MLTKSKLMSWRQCPKRLWLEENGAKRSPAQAGRLAAGVSVGEAARGLYGSAGSVVIDRFALSPAAALARTSELMAIGATIFEGAFGDEELVAYADIVRPDASGWSLLEVKGSGSVKPHHQDDAAIQVRAAHRSGNTPARVAVVHLDTSWIYPGGGDYHGLFKEVELTAEVGALALEVDTWVAQAKATLEAPQPPERTTGRHCEEPNPCPFQDACAAAQPQLARPITWLPGQLRKEAKALRDAGVSEMDGLPDHVLNDIQRRVKQQTLAGAPYFDQAGAASDLAGCSYPLAFLDFETLTLAVPIWAGTWPYAQVPFQFSLHILQEDGSLTHTDFLAATGEDPSRGFAEALIVAAGQEGSVVVYNAGFERTRLRELAARFPGIAPELDAIAGRIFDLQPVAKQRYYHPDQRGSWSIKKILPCLAPELRYDDLDGVQDGGMAIEAYAEMIHPECSAERKAALDAQLRRYCQLDTLAMVALWARFTASDPLLRVVLSGTRG